MQAPSEIFDCNISSTSAVQMPASHGPQIHTDSRDQLSENTESVVTDASSSVSTEAIIQPEDRSNYTKMSNCNDAFSSKEEEGCVSSQQIGSPSSDDENEDDDESWDPEDCDNGSEISEFSDFSQESWQPVQGPIAWVQEQMRRGQSPRKILEDLVPSGTVIPEGLDPIMLWKIIINIVSEPPKRKKLNEINTLDDVLRLLHTSKKIIVLTGAGVSVSCGIPDFRSRGGVYARLAKDFPNLPDPQAMFDIHFFRNDPRPFFKFAREIYPGQFKPSPCHRFIHMLEEKGKLLRNYTQNIDTLEQVAGIERVVQCHGSFATATCTVCGHKVDSNAIKEDIFNQVIPHCSSCSPSDQNAVMKPDIVFFGESLPEHFHNQMAADKDECDLLIVIGSSLKVRPVALIPNSLPASIPQILINRERLHYLNFDVELLGNCDEIVGELCRRLGPGWEELAAAGPPINEVLMSSLPTPPASPHSGESRDKWEEASNPAVSSSNGNICSKNTPNTHTVSLACSAHLATNETGENCMISTQGLSTHDDNGHKVSTSQSEPNLPKIHKNCHQSPHKHSLKRPLSEITTADALSDEAVSNLPGSDQAIFCSDKEVETLVSACHKKDVMFIPTDKSLQHHGFNSQQSYDRAKSYAHHHNHSSIHEQSESSTLKHKVPSQTFIDNGHNSNLMVSESSKEVSSNHDVCTTQVHEESQLETLHNNEQKSTCCSKSSEAAHLQERETDDDCPKSKKPRLINKECQQEDSKKPRLINKECQQEDSKKPRLINKECQQEDSKKPRLINKECQQEDSKVELEEERDGKVDPYVRESSLCDSLSQDESLYNIRKMWHSRCRVSLAQRLEGNQVLFLPPSRYVFKGAEVFSGSESDNSDDSDDDSTDDSTDEDDSSGDNDVDKVSKDVVVSGKPNAEKSLDSPTSAPRDERLNRQQLMPSSSAGDRLIRNIIDLSTQKTPAAKGCSGFDQEARSVQDNECTSLSASKCPQTKMSENLVTCPVSSSEDFDLGQPAQISNRLHSLQDQRD